MHTNAYDSTICLSSNDGCPQVHSRKCKFNNFLLEKEAVQRKIENIFYCFSYLQTISCLRFKLINIFKDPMS